MRDIYLSGVGVGGIRYIHTCTHSLDVAINGLFAWLNKYRQKGKNEGVGGGISDVTALWYQAFT